jgi:adenylate cyclase
MANSANKNGIDTAQDFFEQQLEKQILVSEKKRVTILAVILTFMALNVFIMGCCFPNTFPKEFSNSKLYGLSLWIWLDLLFIFSAIYEWLIRIFLNNAIKRGKQIPAFLRYLNVFEETSLPSVAIFLVAQVVDPALALVAPPSFFYFIFIILASLRLDFKLCLFTGTVAAIEYVLLAWFFIPLTEFEPDIVLTLLPHYIVKAVVLFVTGLVTGLITLQLRKQISHSFRSIQERNDIANIFGQHVSPAVVEKLLHQPTEMSTETRHVCVMFLDIRDFTTFSENHPPEEIVNFLNTLFEPMIEIVNRHQGVINKFLGDGFMAIFGAPLSDGNDSQHAVKTAQEIIETVKQTIVKGEILPIRIGIGLHTGQAVTGNVGSTQRKEYTVIGDVVNLASRIEQLNKQFDSQLLISTDVWEAIGKNIDTVVDKGLIQVKGRKEAVQIYQIC